MFYHSLPLPKAYQPDPPDSWWSIHAETLTPIHITVRKAIISGSIADLAVVSPPSQENHVHRSHTLALDLGSIRTSFLPDLARLNTSIHCGRISKVSRAELPPPEYLLVWDIHGNHPAIARTADPMLIIPSDPQNPIALGTATPYYRTATDLPAEGWAYWWEDAHRAYDDLIRPLISDSLQS